MGSLLTDSFRSSFLSVDFLVDLGQFIIVLFFVFLIIYLLHKVVTSILSLIYKSHSSKYLRVVLKELKKFPSIVWFVLALIITSRSFPLTNEEDLFLDFIDQISIVVAGIGVTLVANRVIAGVIKIYTEEHSDDENSDLYRYFQNLSKALVWIFSVITILSILDYNIESVIAAVGLSSFAIAFALRGFIKDIIGSFVIVFTKPFKVGDYIKSGEHYGRVEDIGIRSTRVESIDKRIINIPNNILVGKPVQNYENRTNAIVTYAIKLETSRLSKYEKPLQTIINKLYKEFKEITPETIDLVLTTLSKEKHEYKLMMELDMKDRKELDKINKTIMHRIFELFKEKDIKLEEITVEDKVFAK